MIILFCQMFFKTGFVAYWKINQTYIAQKLCVNKANPKMHCNGECYLMKQLKKVDNSQDTNKNFPNSIVKLKTFDHFIVSKYVFKLNESGILKKHEQNSLNHSFSLSKGYLRSLYRPPEFI